MRPAPPSEPHRAARAPRPLRPSFEPGARRQGMAAQEFGRTDPPAAGALQLEDFERALAATDDQAVGQLPRRKARAIGDPSPPDLELGTVDPGRGARRGPKGAHRAFELLCRTGPVQPCLRFFDLPSVSNP